MHKRLGFLFGAFAALTIGGGAAAAVVTIAPSEQSAAIGEQVSVDLVVSGLGNGWPHSVGIFDFDLIFDDALLSVDRVIFGDQLDLFGFGAYRSVEMAAPGVLTIFEASIDPPEYIDFFQAPSFTLATIVFDTLSAGVSALMLDVFYFGDAWWYELDVNTVNASVSIESAVSEAPLPSALFLLLTGLLGLRFARSQ